MTLATIVKRWAAMLVPRRMDPRRPKMRRLALSAVILFALAAPEAAQAERWCVRDFGATQRTCVFPSLRDCTFAVRVRGGICERDTAAETRTGPTSDADRPRKR